MPELWTLGISIMTDSLKSEMWKEYSVRPYLGKGRPQFVLPLLGIMILGLIVGSWTGYPVTSFIVALVLTVVLATLVDPLKCPKCNGKVKTRVFNDDPDSIWYYHDCPKCQISWESKKYNRSDT